jgi:hypothetical protein
VILDRRKIAEKYERSPAPQKSKKEMVTQSYRRDETNRLTFRTPNDSILTRNQTKKYREKKKILKSNRDIRTGNSNERKLGIQRNENNNSSD